METNEVSNDVTCCNNEEKDAREPTTSDRSSTHLTNITCTHLLDLNYDCLREIFSLLSIVDLCSLAQTSKHLKWIAVEIFTRKYADFKYGNMWSHTVAEVKQIFHNFGSLITKLYIHLPRSILDDYKEPLCPLELVAKYCSNLVSLNISFRVLFTEQSVTLKPVLNKLQKLTFSTRNMRDAIPDLFANCESLVEFYLECDTERDVISGNVFPKLQRLKCFFGRSFFISHDDWEKFIPRHKNLKDFKIYCRSDCTFLFPLIAENCKELEEFEARSAGKVSPAKFEMAVQSLLTLTSLRKLDIECGEKDVTKFVQSLASFKSLEYMRLCGFRSDNSEIVQHISRLHTLRILLLLCKVPLDNIDLLSNLDQLTQLTICYSDKTKVDFDLVNFINRLINLERLHLWMNFRVDRKMYLKIVEVVRRRPFRIQFIEIFAGIIHHPNSHYWQWQCYQDNCNVVRLRELDV